MKTGNTGTKHEILFRARRSDSKEWVEGYYYAAVWTYIVQEHPRTFIIVDRETVGQYTGFRDRNGRRIFEGDIIRRGDEILVAVWQRARFAALKKNRRPIAWQYVSADGEVIGNIWDNPELLERRRK